MSEDTCFYALIWTYSLMVSLAPDSSKGLLMFYLIVLLILVILNSLVPVS